ncbi:MAG: hypothetical protein HUU04_07660 [Verrucomicrobiae bacterium]|nr:hypothetical protein [Verrucomicrobiae bacterium]
MSDDPSFFRRLMDFGAWLLRRGLPWVFRPSDPMSDLNETIQKAYDYRGDVTVTLKDGSEVVGFLFNREMRATSRLPEPFVEMMIAGSEERRLIPLSKIAKIDLTGEDAAAGKSWEEWMAKQTSKKAHPG